MSDLRQTEDLEPWVERIIEKTIMKHQMQCPLFDRVRLVEMRFAYLLGYMVGAGVIGGAGGALVAKLISA